MLFLLLCFAQVPAGSQKGRVGVGTVLLIIQGENIAIRKLYGRGIAVIPIGRHRGDHEILPPGFAAVIAYPGILTLRLNTPLPIGEDQGTGGMEKKMRGAAAEPLQGSGFGPGVATIMGKEGKDQLAAGVVLIVCADAAKDGAVGKFAGMGLKKHIFVACGIGN